MATLAFNELKWWRYFCANFPFCHKYNSREPLKCCKKEAFDGSWLTFTWLWLAITKNACVREWCEKNPLNLLNADFTKWSNTLKQFVRNLFDHLAGLALKGLKNIKALTKISFTLVRVFFMQLYEILHDLRRHIWGNLAVFHFSLFLAQIVGWETKKQFCQQIANLCKQFIGTILAIQDHSLIQLPPVNDEKAPLTPQKLASDHPL